MIWTRALLAFRTRAITLNRAGRSPTRLASNPHVPAYLLGHKPLPRSCRAIPAWAMSARRCPGPPKTSRPGGPPRAPSLGSPKMDRDQATTPALRKLRGETMKETSDYGSRLKALKEEQPASNANRPNCSKSAAPKSASWPNASACSKPTTTLFAGALLELKECQLAKTGDERLARWRAAGASFRRGRQRPQSCCAARGQWRGGI